MGCKSDSACNGCTSNYHENGKPIDIEDYQAELLVLKKRTREIEAKLSESGHGRQAKLRSSLWFNNKDNPAMSGLYIDRYLNYGLTREELRSNKPVIGIAQTGSDLAPCNRHHLELAKRVREGIRSAGAIAFEFPVHPIQETSRRLLRPWIGI